MVFTAMLMGPHAQDRYNLISLACSDNVLNLVQITQFNLPEMRRVFFTAILMGPQTKDGSYGKSGPNYPVILHQTKKNFNLPKMRSVFTAMLFSDASCVSGLFPLR